MSSVAAPSSRGGAWEVILDKATLEVTNYLSASTKPFDPTGPLSPHMLALLDRTTLLDIVKERNFNRLCGRPGCPELPSGLQGEAATRDIDFSKWRSTLSGVEGEAEDALASSESSVEASSSDDESATKPRHRRKKRHGTARALRELEEMDPYAIAQDDGNDKEEYNPMVKEGDIHLASAAADGTEEIEYDDDVVIAESFRLAAREQRLLRQLQRKQKTKLEKARARRAQDLQKTPSAKPATRCGPAPAVGGASGMFGATMEERFCTPLCLEAFQDELLPLVPPLFVYNHEVLLDAVSSLFPSLRPDTLRQLAGLEAQQTPLVKDVVEKAATRETPSAEGLKPVQVGDHHESTATRGTLTQEASPPKSESPMKTAAAAAAMTGQMERRDVLWDAAVVYRLHRNVFSRSQESEETRTKGKKGTTMKDDESPSTTEVRQRNGAPDDDNGDTEAVALPPLRPLKGPLLVLDFLLNVSSNTTKKLFLLHYLHAHQSNASLSSSAVGVAPSSPVYDKLVSPVEQVLRDKAVKWLPEWAADPAATRARLLHVEDDLRVEPSVQQQRRELVVSQLFSTELAGALSRLVWIDAPVVLEMAWERVWFLASTRLLPSVTAAATSPSALPPPPSAQQAFMAFSLINSLTFPFPVPAVLLRPLALSGATAPPEVIAMGLIMLLAAAMCHSGVRAALAESDEALEEVLYAVGMSAEDATAALKALMLFEED